jgi:hypothetical protein
MSRRNWLVPAVALGLWVLLCAVSAEVGARAFWSLRYGVPFRHPGRILYAFYPGLERIDRKRPSAGDGYYDVLFLGGSTLDEHWGEVDRALGERLAFQGHRNVRIFNLAVPAHTSRDSRLKYEALGRVRFDLVVIYDGFNDIRTNNVPPGLYRQDYGHYAWYETVNALAPYHRRSTRFALPYTLRFLAIGFRRALTKDRYVPTEEPRPDWVRYGENARSAAPFEDNLTAILDLAARRGDRVLLMTFAAYVPENYSPEAFEAKRLDYGLHLSPLELWGRRDHVLAALARHNEIVRTLAGRHPEGLFVDQARLMDGSPRYFNDPCHLTVEGSARFAENLLPVILPTFPSR